MNKNIFIIALVLIAMGCSNAYANIKPNPKLPGIINVDPKNLFPSQKLSIFCGTPYRSDTGYYCVSCTCSGGTARTYCSPTSGDDAISRGQSDYKNNASKYGCSGATPTAK